MRGVIATKDSKDFGNGPLWSFQLKGDRTWYRAGKFFKNNEGDYVEFDVEVVGKNTRALKIRQLPPDQSVASAGSASAAAVSKGVSSTGSQGEYWAAREARDIETQKRIERQSCRNSALELVKLMLTESIGAVKLPGKQADKARAVEELVAHYTQVFIDDNKGLGQPTPAQNDNVDPDPEVTTTDNKKNENNDDSDNWN